MKMKAIVAALFAISMLAMPASAQTPATDARPGIIRGQILTPAGRPARRASVRILPPTGGFPRSVSADLEGRYEFTDVAAGDYRVSAGKPGYLAIEFGQQRAFEHGKVVTVGAGQTLEKIDITLPAGGTISGRVVDANGDPVERIDVRLMEVHFGANRRQLGAVAGVAPRPTDDQGRYRLYGVPPGEYIVSASVIDPMANPAPNATAAILPKGYTSTYAPGTVNASEAKMVPVGLSEQLANIDITLGRADLSRVSGTVVNAAGQPQNARVVMMRSQRSGGISTEPLLAPSSPDDGKFEIRGVPPGEWTLQVLSGRSSMNQAQEGEFAARFVTVNGADVSDLRLQTSTGSRVEGRIVFEGSGDPTRVVVTTMPSDFDRAPMGGPGARGTGQPDGTFMMDGLNGPRRLRLLGAPPSWTLKAIRVNGIDVTDDSLPFGTRDQSLTDVEVVLTKNAAGITGGVADARGASVTDYTVIVFATRPDRWYQGSRFLTFTRPKADGTFAVADLPPGEYYVAAVDRMQGTEGFGEWQDPAVLESLAPGSTRITLGEGQTPSVTPRLIVR
jgi:hypothetical protein